MSLLVGAKTFKPAWANRRKGGGFERAGLRTPTRLVGYGDSLLDGTGATNNFGFFHKLAAPTNLTLVELGNGGETMFAISARVVADIAAYNANTDVFILQGGWNNRANAASFDIQAVADAVAAFKTLSPDVRYLVLGVPTSSDSLDFIGGANRVNIDAMNASRASVYGGRFVEINTMLGNNYNSGVPQDVTDHANGIVPSSLRADTIHWNDAGHTLVRDAVLAKLQAFGWIGAAPVAPAGSALDPATKAASATLSNFNLTVANASGADAAALAISTTSKTSGKRVVKFTMGSSLTTEFGLTIAPTAGDYIGGTAGSLAYWSSGNVFDSSYTVRSSPGSAASGAVVLLAVDWAANKYWFNLNGNGWSNTGDPSAGAGGHALPAAMQGVPLFAAVECSTNGSSATIDFNPTGHGLTGFVGWDG